MSPPTEIDFHDGIANVMMNKVGNRSTEENGGGHRVRRRRGTLLGVEGASASGELQVSRSQVKWRAVYGFVMRPTT